MLNLSAFPVRCRKRLSVSLDICKRSVSSACVRLLSFSMAAFRASSFRICGHRCVHHKGTDLKNFTRHYPQRLDEFGDLMQLPASPNLNRNAGNPERAASAQQHFLVAVLLMTDVCAQRVCICQDQCYRPNPTSFPSRDVLLCVSMITSS